MARYTEAVCRQCRREGQKLFLKGDRCYTQKCAIDCRGYAPGQHGQGRSKTSEYGSQLREKQKVRRYYGVLEKQFRTYFAMAEKRQGITGENLLAILEYQPLGRAERNADDEQQNDDKNLRAAGLASR